MTALLLPKHSIRTIGTSPEVLQSEQGKQQMPADDTFYGTKHWKQRKLQIQNLHKPNPFHLWFLQTATFASHSHSAHNNPQLAHSTNPDTK